MNNQTKALQEQLELERQRTELLSKKLKIVVEWTAYHLSGADPKAIYELVASLDAVTAPAPSAN
jgi:hypothetical protein